MSEEKDQKTNELGYGTTGHSWDGIEEWNNPMPRWWVWTFYATVIWGIIYTILYPAWPLIERATPGLIGQNTRLDVAADIAAVNERNAGLNEALASVDLAALTDDANLNSYAVNMGASVFLNNCSQCHGAGAQGVQAAGYPNLNDDAWLWGGEIDQIAYTVANGIRNEQSPDAHWSEMPAYAEILSEEEIAAVVQYVRQISEQEHDAALASAGAETFLNECSSCHGEDGKGMQDLGAPNLTDPIWLYGGSVETLTETVANARFGVMPAWSEDYRVGSGLTQAQINAVAAYVHQLGGGQ